jgi:hypothetical protein
MRFREQFLGGSAAMPGATLQRACRLLVAVCALHLGVTLVYYLSGRDLSRLPQLVGVSSTLQGGTNGAAASKQPPGEQRPRGARPPPPLGVSPKPRPGLDSSPGAASGPGLKSNLSSLPVPTTTGLLSLPACPEESPLLGKTQDLRTWTPRISSVGFQGYYPKISFRTASHQVLIRVHNPQEGLNPLWDDPKRGWLVSQEAGALLGNPQALTPAPDKALETPLFWPRTQEV